MNAFSTTALSLFRIGAAFRRFAVDTCAASDFASLILPARGYFFIGKAIAKPLKLLEVVLASLPAR
jgi:hypothetical protein